VAVSIKTGRGNYWLKTAAPVEQEPDGVLLTLVLERADGIEQVAFRCRIASELLDGGMETEAMVERLGPWVEREFEMTRENALKTIRSERKMMDIVFDANNRGPF
jgi:Trp operon repressor